MPTVTEDDFKYESGDILEEYPSGNRCEVGDLLYVVDKGVREYKVFWKHTGDIASVSTQTAEEKMEKVGEVESEE